MTQSFYQRARYWREKRRTPRFPDRSLHGFAFLRENFSDPGSAGVLDSQCLVLDFRLFVRLEMSLNVKR